MGQTISINKGNIHKTHRFTDEMYEKLDCRVNDNNATIYEKQFRNTMKPVFENNLNIPIFYCIYISNYCIISRRLNKSHLIETKALLYCNQKKYKKFTNGYAKLVKTTFQKFSKT